MEPRAWGWAVRLPSLLIPPKKKKKKRARERERESTAFSFLGGATEFGGFSQMPSGGGGVTGCRGRLEATYPLRFSAKVVAGGKAQA